MFPATGTSHIALKRWNIGIFIRKTRTVSSDTSRGARVFFRKWRRFKDFEIISIFLYVILHTIRRISSFSAKIYRLQSVVKVYEKNHRRLLVLLLRFGENRGKRNKDLVLAYLFTSIYSSCHRSLLLFIIIYY